MIYYEKPNKRREQFVMATYSAKIRLPKGGDHQITVEAKNSSDAKNLIEAQYSGAKILSLVLKR